MPVASQRPVDHPHAPRGERSDRIDALRGVAIVWMTVFHFCFDLNHFGWLNQNFYADPLWTWQRTFIVSLFLFCTGMGQAMAVDQGQGWPRFWKRWVQIAACALLVTAASLWMYPKSYIYFGVLHAIAIMLIVARLSAGWGRWLWIAGLICIAMKPAAELAHQTWPALEFLNAKPFNWLGLVSRKPIAEDYVPLIPWLGVTWWGMAAGQWVLARRRGWISKGIPAGTAPLAWLGRWSLSWYMLHQPVMIGLLMVIGPAGK